MSYQIIQGDCIEEMRRLEADSTDALVTDPPYGIRFMGKAWDGADIERTIENKARKGEQEDADRKRIGKAQSAGLYDLAPPAMLAFQEWTRDWAMEALRVLKPGGHALIFCGPRTYHRMACGVEEAGFELRDQLQWVFGQGFPKSLDISKAIDKHNGDTRERNLVPTKNGNKSQESILGHAGFRDLSSAASAAWEGWGTALKPAYEPILLARKPISEKNVAANVLRWGTGGLNIDGGRIGTESAGWLGRPASALLDSSGPGASKTGFANGGSPRPVSGRFPANLLLSHTPYCTDEQCDMECAIRRLDEQSGTLKSGSRVAGVRSGMGFHGANGEGGPAIVANAGGASRFFYCAKTSPSERNAGLDDAPDVVAGIGDDRPSGQSMSRLDGRPPRVVKNHHPTVKPLKLMRYLCKLVTPPGGLILDPFLGSGSTGVAALSEGFRFVGIEKDEDYVWIAEKRLKYEAELHAAIRAPMPEVSP